MLFRLIFGVFFVVVVAIVGFGLPIFLVENDSYRNPSGESFVVERKNGKNRRLPYSIKSHFVTDINMDLNSNTTTITMTYIIIIIIRYTM